MQKRCSKCNRPIKEVGRLVKVSWLGFRAPLCKNCRKELRSKKANIPVIGGILRRLRR